MSHSDDLKDRPEDATAPEAVEKQPLGFEQTVAPADPSLTGRRLFLKLALFGAAASMVPDAVMAAVQGEPTAEGPVGLPYKNTLAFRRQEATLSDDKGNESIYLVNGDGDLYIDAGGNVFLSNIKANGTFASGKLDAGPISIVQPAASMAGKYTDTSIDASTMVLYSDKFSQQQPAQLRVAGTLAKANSSLSIGVGFNTINPRQPDIYVEVGWSKVTC